jgi:peroxiredoxin
MTGLRSVRRLAFLPLSGALWAGALGVGALAVGGCAVPVRNAGEDYPIGTSFTLPEARGGMVTGPVTGRGPTVLEFFSPKCLFCVAHAGDLNELHRALARRGGTVMAVALGSYAFADGRPDPESVREFVRAQDVRYPVLLGNCQVADEYAGPTGGIRSLPTTFVIDASGKIISCYVGGASSQTILDDLDRHAASYTPTRRYAASN